MPTSARFGTSQKEPPSLRSPATALLTIKFQFMELFINLPLWGRGTALAVDEGGMQYEFAQTTAKRQHFTAPHPSRLRRATFPKGEGISSLNLNLKHGILSVLLVYWGFLGGYRGDLQKITCFLWGFIKKNMDKLKKQRYNNAGREALPAHELECDHL